eukprot:g42312.t1
MTSDRFNIFSLLRISSRRSLAAAGELQWQAGTQLQCTGMLTLRIMGLSVTGLPASSGQGLVFHPSPQARAKRSGPGNVIYSQGSRPRSRIHTNPLAAFFSSYMVSKGKVSIFSD